MGKVVNKILLGGDTYMPKMHLKQPAALGKLGFTYSACGPFTKKQRKNLKIQGNRRYELYLKK